MATCDGLTSAIKKFDLTEKDANRQVSDEHIESFSRSHGRKWKSLPPYLGLNSIVADDIDRTTSKEDEKRHDFFKEWKQRKGSSATYGKLISALLKIECREDAESLCKMLQSSSHETQEEFKVYNYANFVSQFNAKMCN